MAAAAPTTVVVIADLVFAVFLRLHRLKTDVRAESVDIYLVQESERGDTRYTAEIVYGEKVPKVAHTRPQGGNE